MDSCDLYDVVTKKLTHWKSCVAIPLETRLKKFQSKEPLEIQIREFESLLNCFSFKKVYNILKPVLSRQCKDKDNISCGILSVVKNECLSTEDGKCPKDVELENFDLLSTQELESRCNKKELPACYVHSKKLEGSLIGNLKAFKLYVELCQVSFNDDIACVDKERLLTHYKAHWNSIKYFIYALTIFFLLIK